LTSLRSAGENKLKDGDAIIQEIETHNRAELLLFTNSGEVCKMKVHEFAESKASSMGEYLTNKLSLQEGEKIIYITPAGNYEGFMLFGFENGKFAKIDMGAYATKTNRKRLANAYSTQSRLAYIGRHAAEADIAAYTTKKRTLVFNTALIGFKTTRNALGVQVARLTKGASLAGAGEPEACGVSDREYYRAKTIPSAGRGPRK
jgi:DNA gyrase subunit A